MDLFTDVVFGATRIVRTILLVWTLRLLRKFPTGLRVFVMSYDKRFIFADLEKRCFALCVSTDIGKSDL